MSVFCYKSLLYFYKFICPVTVQQLKNSGKEKLNSQATNGKEKKLSDIFYPPCIFNFSHFILSYFLLHPFQNICRSQSLHTC